MGSHVEPDEALGELRHLLFGVEARRLDEMEAELRLLAAAKLDRADLLAATAEVLAGALRRAEVARHRELAEAMAPLVVGAIRAEIRNSKDSMVEALYPLMGRLVSAAVAAAIRNLADDLARRIDALISARAWRWRLKSWATGRPIGEIALADSQRARIVRILCLERGSGQLLAAWPDAEADGRSDLVSGMIAAISEFAATTFAREGGELRALDLGSQNVLLRSSATVIVAAECEGVLDAEDEARIDTAFLRLIARHEREGRLGPAHLATMADGLKRADVARRPGWLGVWLVRIGAAAACVAVLWFAGGAFLNWRREVAVTSALAEARAGAPETAPWPLALSFDHAARRVRLAGLLPDSGLTERIAPALERAAAPYTFDLQVDIVADRAAAEARAAALEARLAESEAARRRDNDAGSARLAALAAELAAARRDAATATAVAAQQADRRASALESAQAEAAAAASAARAELRRTQEAALAAAADAASRARAETEARAAALHGRLGGVEREVAAIQAEARTPLAQLRAGFRDQAIFFSHDAEFVDENAARATVARIAALLREARTGLRVVGHTDESGSAQINLRRSRERADAVVRLLTEAGVPAQSIRIASRRANTPISDVASAGSSPNRRVTFELLLDEEPVQ